MEVFKIMCQQGLFKSFCFYSAYYDYRTEAKEEERKKFLRGRREEFKNGIEWQETKKDEWQEKTDEGGISGEQKNKYEMG